MRLKIFYKTYFQNKCLEIKVIITVRIHYSSMVISLIIMELIKCSIIMFSINKTQVTLEASNFKVNNNIKEELIILVKE